MFPDSLKGGTYVLTTRSSMHMRYCTCDTLSVKIPPLSRKTLKDVSRERFAVNKVPTDPSQCWSQIQTLLLQAAVQDQKQQQQQQQQATPGRVGRPPDAAAVQPDTGGARTVTDTAAASATGTDTGTGAAAESATPKGVKDKEDVRPSRSVPADQEVDHTSRGPDGCNRCSDARPSGVRVHGEGGRGGGPVEGGVGGGAKDGGGAVAAKSALETYVDQCAWRVLHAASRTASGGDSFFVVQVWGVAGSIKQSGGGGGGWLSRQTCKDALLSQIR